MKQQRALLIVSAVTVALLAASLLVSGYKADGAWDITVTLRTPTTLPSGSIRYITSSNSSVLKYAKDSPDAASWRTVKGSTPNTFTARFRFAEGRTFLFTHTTCERFIVVEVDTSSGKRYEMKEVDAPPPAAIEIAISP